MKENVKEIIRNREKQPEKVEHLFRDSYLAFIRNSIGSKAYRSSFAKVNGKGTDILRGGRRSCAFFVSSTLKVFELLREDLPKRERAPHATTAGTLKDMEKSGWKEVGRKKVSPGDIVVWDEHPATTIARRDPIQGIPHIGFYIGNGWTISASDRKRIIARHHFRFGGKRKVVAVYRHPKINK